MTIKKKRKTPAKRRKRKPKAPKPQMIVVTQEPTEIIQRTVPPQGKGKKVWDAVNDIRKTLFLGFWAMVGLAPISAHIGSQFYCGVGEAQKCTPMEFPAWMEAGGIVLAMIMANAMRDIVSKSATQFFGSMKDLPKLLRGSRNGTSEHRSPDTPQDK